MEKVKLISEVFFLLFLSAVFLCFINLSCCNAEYYYCYFFSLYRVNQADRYVLLNSKPSSCFTLTRCVPSCKGSQILTWNYIYHCESVHASQWKTFFKARPKLDKIIYRFNVSVKIHSLFIARTTFCFDEYFDKTTP